jgi:hypothetical protein
MIEQNVFQQSTGRLVQGDNRRVDNTKAKRFSRILRSIGAVLSGLIATVVLSLGTDFLMHATGVYPAWSQPMDDSQFALATAYRSVYAITGSYVSALVASFQPMQHAVALGVVGMVLATKGAITTWNAGPQFARRWYAIALILLSIPYGWLGGKVRVRQLSK